MEIKNNSAGVDMNFQVKLNVHRMRRMSRNPETHVYTQSVPKTDDDNGNVILLK